MPADAQADLNALASRTLHAIGAQREMPQLTVEHGWSLFGWLLGARPVAANILLIAVLLLCAGFILLAVMSARRRRIPKWETHSQLAAAANPATPHLDIADGYADEGRFVEAIHELLLQGLADIRAQSGSTLSPSLTSREILREANLAEMARDALRVLVGRVEWTYLACERRQAAITKPVGKVLKPCGGFCARHEIVRIALGLLGHAGDTGGMPHLFRRAAKL